MAKTLTTIGVIEMICGVIAACIVTDMTSNELIPIILVAAGIINGVLFCGFGTVVRLLEESVANQKKIIEKLWPESKEDVVQE